MPVMLSPRPSALLALYESSCSISRTQAVGDERFECAALASVRSKYASLVISSSDTMRSIFAQPDHMGVFKHAIDCVDFMNIGTCLPQVISFVGWQELAKSFFDRYATAAIKHCPAPLPDSIMIMHLIIHHAFIAYERGSAVNIAMCWLRSSEPGPLSLPISFGLMFQLIPTCAVYGQDQQHSSLQQ